MVKILNAVYFFVNMNSEDLLNFEELDCQIQSIIDHSELQSNLKIQLGEIDVLRAMYYQEKEFVIDELAFEKVNDYVFGNSHDIPPTLDFSINLTMNNMLLETHVILPKSYPSVPPKVYVRSNLLKRIQQDALNGDLDSYLQSLDRGTICIYEGISWLTENIGKYCLKEPNRKETNEDDLSSQKSSPCLFLRYWIYSHHIYSKDKRREILALSKTNDITGFCLSGKPGIICAEGLERDCNEWWQNVRGMSWKKIMCKQIEELPSNLDSLDTLRKFDNFCEINFPSVKNHKSQDNHTNMGDFYRYLVEHNCEHVFKDYFGIEPSTQ